MKLNEFRCPLCNKTWTMLADNPDEHTEVPCPACLMQTHRYFEAELRHIEFGLPRGYIEVPAELEALHLGHDEFYLRLAAYRLGLPLDKLVGPPRKPVQ